MKNASESLPGTALNKIGKLFKIEKETEDKNPQEKVEIRLKEAKPLLKEFFSWCTKNQCKVLSGSKIYKAFQYALNHKQGLMEYTGDGNLPGQDIKDTGIIDIFMPWDDEVQKRCKL